MIRDSTRIKSLKGRKKWTPWRATDLESLMYPNLFIGLMFGCCPYKYESTTYVFSGTRFVYCTFMSINCTCLILIAIYEINFETVGSYYIPGKIHSNICLLLGGGIIMTMYVLSRPRLRFLQSLLETSRMLSPKDFNDLAKFVHTTNIFSFLFLIVHLPNCFKKDGYTIRYLILFYITQVSLTLDMFYTNCVCILKACFRKIRRNLEQLKRPLRNDESFSKTPWRKSPFDEQGSTLLVMRLKRLGEEHLRISNVVQLLNKTFLVHITALAVMTFSNITFNLYFYVILLGGGGPAYVNGQFWYTLFLPSVIYQMVKFLIMIWACQTAKTEALEIGMTVHDVLSSATDASLKHELMLFSLQLLHRDNTFSARLVTMNATLLMEILGGIVMYLLILIQFLLNNVNCLIKNALHVK